jgi:hypothetical protein
VEVQPRLVFFWTAFADLSSDRQLGFGVRPIPWSAVDRFADRYGVPDDMDEYERFKTLIRLMDQEFMRWRAEKDE